ncbi:MAG: hypothetical protein AAGA99_03780 [Actinomycetota bacterium]
MGLISRHLEAAGYPTVQLTSALTITARTFPPRAAIVDAPLGHTAGPPHDRAMQRRIVRDALELIGSATEPGTAAHLPYRWHDDAWRGSPLSWARDNPSAADIGDTRTPRNAEPQYQTSEDQRLAATRSRLTQCRTCIGLE